MAKKTKVLSKEDKELNDIREVISTPAGRRLYWRVLEDAGVFRKTFSANNINLTNYLEGRRSIGLNFLHDLFKAKPDSFSQMQKEHSAGEKRDEIREEIKQSKSSVLDTGD